MCDSVLVLLTVRRIAILHLHDCSNLRSVMVPTLWVQGDRKMGMCLKTAGLGEDCRFALFEVKMY